MKSEDFHTKPDGMIEIPEGTVIFNEQSKAKTMYVVVQGEVLISLRGKRLGVATAGEVVGEMALLKATVRSATATTQTDCLLDPIDKEHFESIIQKSPAFALYVMNIMAERIRLSNEILVSRS